MDTKTKYLCTVIYQQKKTHAHSVFEVNFVPLELITEYLKKPTLDRALVTCTEITII